jgi:putative ABC transport system permease protein
MVRQVLVVLRRFAASVRPRQVESQLEAEVRDHLDSLAHDHMRRGMSRVDAFAAARRDFGGLDQMKEQYRDRRGLPVVDALRQDLRFGWRLLHRSPGFTTAAVAILALGIGATTAIFSLVDATMIRALPYRDPERIVMIWERTPRFPRSRVSPLNFLDWHDRSRSFDAMAAAAGGGASVVSDGSGRVDNVLTLSVTPEFFQVFGVVPIAGRLLVEDDARLGRNVAVVSERLWKTRFGADPGLVGRQLMTAAVQQPFTVVGIVPADFEAWTPADMWVLLGPIARRPDQRRSRFLPVMARLKPGVSIDAARSEMSAVAATIARENPETNANAGVTIEPLRQSIVGDDLRTTTIVLGGVVAFVLLLACANVANLLLARGVTRRREVAVRAALGGGRWRIVRQFLTETTLLASLGGIVGLTLAWAALRVAPSILPPGTVPVGVALRFDLRLALFAAIVTFTTAVVAGLAPTWRAARVTLTEAMAGSRSSTDHNNVFRHVLTIVEVAAAVLLVVGAGLLVRTLVSLEHVDPGYRADRVLTMQIGLELPRYPTPESRMAFYQAIQDEVSRVPGVRTAALGFDVPFDGVGANTNFTVVGGAAESARRQVAHYQMVSPPYFDTLGIPVLRGRAFTDRDSSTSTPVCIVNEEFARRYLSDRDPIGATITAQTLALAPTVVTREVVGVIRQVKERPHAADNQLEIYVPLAQNSWFNATIVVRAAVPPATLVPQLRDAVARVRKDLGPTRIRTMEDVAEESTATPRFRARLVGAFAVLAMLLAAAGVFSVFTFTVQQRTREFSIRMALGARSADVLSQVLGDGARVIAIGLVIGIAASAALVQSMASLLFAVKPFDPIAFAGGSTLLALTALTACAIPAISASRSDPAATLRED